MNLPLNTNYTPKSTGPNIDYAETIRKINEQIASSSSQAPKPRALPRFDPQAGMQQPRANQLPLNTPAVDPSALPRTAQATPVPPTYTDLRDTPKGDAIARSGPMYPGQYTIDSQGGSFVRNIRPQFDDPFWRARKEQLLGGRPAALFEVDHIVPLWAGGTNDDSNLVVLPIHKHNLKSTAQDVPSTLLDNGLITKEEALRIALTWEERDLSALPKPEELDQGKFVKLEDAKRVYELWKKQETNPTLGKNWFETLKKKASFIKPLESTEKLINKVTSKLPNIIQAPIRGALSGATAGYVGYTEESDYTALDKFVGNIGYGAGMILPIARVAKVLGVVGKIGAVNKVANTTARSLVGAGNIVGNSATRAGEFVARKTLGWTGFKFGVNQTIDKTRQAAISRILANNIIKWTPPAVLVGQLQAPMFEEENNNLWQRTEQLFNDLTFGVLTGFFQPTIKASAKVGLITSLIAYTTSDGDWDTALSTGVTMAGLHRLGGIGFNKQVEDEIARGLNQMLTDINPVSMATLKAYGANVPLKDGVIPDVPLTTPMVQQWRKEAEEGLIKKAFGDDKPEAETIAKGVKDGEQLPTTGMAWDDFVHEYNAVKVHGEILEFQTLPPAQQETRAAENLFSLIEMNKEGRILRVLPPKLQNISEQIPMELIKTPIKLEPADAGTAISGTTVTTGIGGNVNINLGSTQRFIDAGEKRSPVVLLVRRDDIGPMIERMSNDPNFAFKDDNPRQIVQVLGFREENGSMIVEDLGFLPQASTLEQKNATNRGVQKGTYQGYEPNFNKDTIYSEMLNKNLDWTIANVKTAGYQAPNFRDPDFTRPFIELEINETHWKRSAELQGDAPVRDQNIVKAKPTPELVQDALIPGPRTMQIKEEIKERVKVPAKEIFDVEEAANGKTENVAPATMVKTTLDKANEVLQAQTPDDLAKRYKEEFSGNLTPQETMDLFEQRNDLTVRRFVNKLSNSGDPFVQMLAKNVITPVLENPTYKKTPTGNTINELRVTGASAPKLTLGKRSGAPVLEQTQTKAPSPKTKTEQLTQPITQTDNEVLNNKQKLTLGKPSGAPVLQAGKTVAETVNKKAPVQSVLPLETKPRKLTMDDIPEATKQDPGFIATLDKLKEKPKLSLGKTSGAPVLKQTTSAVPTKVEQPITTQLADIPAVREGDNFETPKPKEKKPRWRDNVITEKYRKGVAAPVANLKLTQAQKKLFTEEGLRKIAKEVSQDGRKLAGGFNAFKERIEKNMQEVLKDPNYRITDKQDISDLRSKYVTLGKAATRKRLMPDGSVLDGPLQNASEIELLTENFRKEFGLKDDSLTVLHIDKGAVSPITKAKDYREQLDAIAAHLQKETDNIYLPFGLIKKGPENVVWVKYEPKVAQMFDSNPSKYKTERDGRLTARDKFMRVFAVDVLKLPPDADAGNILNKRSGLLFQSYREYPGSDAGANVKMMVLTSKKLKDVVDRPQKDIYVKPDDPRVERTIDGFLDMDKTDGQFYIGENLFDSYATEHGFTKNVNSLKGMITSIQPDGTRVTHKGVFKKMDTAIREYLKTDHGYTPTADEIVSFNTNAKIGPKSGEINIKKGDVYFISKTAGGDASFGVSFQRKFQNTDEGVTQFVVDQTLKLKQDIANYSNLLNTAKNQEEFSAVLEQLSNERGVNIDTILNNEAFQLGASKITLEKEIQKLLKNLFYDYLLLGKTKESASVYFSDPLPLKLDGPNKPARLPKDDEIIIGEELMKAKGLKEGDEVVITRSPSIHINNMVVAKVRNGTALGHTSLGKEYSFMSAFNERVRLQADQDGDTMSIFKTDGSGAVSPAHVKAIKARGSGVIPFSEVNKIEGGYGPITYDSVMAAIKNQLVGDQQTGIISNAHRISEALHDNKIEVILSPGKSVSTQRGTFIDTNFKVISGKTVIDSGSIPQEFKGDGPKVYKPQGGYEQLQELQQALQEAVDSKSSADIVKRTANNNPNWIYTILFKDKQGMAPSFKEAGAISQSLTWMQNIHSIIKNQSDYDSIEKVTEAIAPYVQKLQLVEEAGGKLTPFQEKMKYIVDTPGFSVDQALKNKADQNAAKAVEQTFKKTLPEPSQAYFDFYGFLNQKRADYFMMDPPGDSKLTPKERRKIIRTDVNKEFNERLNAGEFSDDDLKNISFYAASSDNWNFSVRNKEKGNTGFKFVYRFQDMINADRDIARVYYNTTESTTSLVGEAGNNS